ncbi:MAG: nickel pincer cofactor biosynthesis protein LarC [Spirochaetes bacterium]|jgi:hypothetical protein|nr:nickel pincer cofactor biosynthesis protein LarC [Spirochaetota bacterium]
MKTAYIDCFSGISGDMFIGSLIDCGLDFTALKNEIKKTGLEGYELTSEKTSRKGISCTRFTVSHGESAIHRNLSDILALINKSGISGRAKKISSDVFMRLAGAESKVHGVPAEDCEFHEVGAVDSIIDIVGAAVGLELMGIEKIYSSPVNLGGGMISAAHGNLPVPSPATIILLEGALVYSGNTKSELTTPTGAALLSVLAESFGGIPEMKALGSGYGAGSRDLEDPNVLRVIIGEAEEGEKFERDDVLIIETNIDDMNPEIYEHVIDRILNAGAADAYLVPAIMKKSRPASVLTVIAGRDDLDRISEIIFAETTTSGLRISGSKRMKLARKSIAVPTRYGRIRVKIHMMKERMITASPEYEDCRKAAVESGAPLREIYDEARRLALKEKATGTEPAD